MEHLTFQKLDFEAPKKVARFELRILKAEGVQNLPSENFAGKEVGCRVMLHPLQAREGQTARYWAFGIDDYVETKSLERPGSEQ